MSSKHSVRSKPSTTGKIKKPIDIYEEFRPHSGIRYDLDQTEANVKAGYTKIKVQHTTVEYEPGQDLNALSQKKIRYARERNRAPVWVFQEEIDERDRSIRAKAIAKATLEGITRRKKQDRLITQAIHNIMMSRIGPIWFHELAPSQMENADTLHVALKQDRKYKCIRHTVDKLIGIGLVLLPHNTKISYCIKHYHNCPTEFLLKIYQLTHIELEKKDTYTLNDRILLSCITHLALRQTLRELHLRIPSPPREEIVKKPRRFSFELELRKQRKMKFKSPYIKPTIFIPQLHKHEVYMNRHKEYPSSIYFDYVDDMYNITYEEIIKKPTKGLGLENSKYSKPPKIRVRQMQSKIEKRKLYNLKKPSAYVSPCTIVFKEPEPEPEPEPETNLCNCTPASFNKDTAFELQIKITTSNEVMTFTQTLCPYSTDCTVDELKLKDHVVIDPELKTDDICPSTGFKHIEYTCECSACKKPVNIISNSLNKFSIYNNCDASNENTETYNEPKTYTESTDISKVCKCPSLASKDPCEDPGDVCDCDSLTEDCTCCICAQNQEFVLKLKRYNEAFNTNIKPCLCACKCKKHRKDPCCPTPLQTEQRKCKYCFCNKIRRRPDEPMPGDEETVEDVEAAEEIVEEKKEEKPDKKTDKKTDKTPDKKTDKTPDKKQDKTPDKKQDKTPDKKQDKTPNKKQDKKPIEVIETANSEDESVCEECKCAQMYDKYITSHESCVDLFKEYQEKMKQDLDDYLKDLEERCICGDSISNLEEEESSAKEEDSSCSCLKLVNIPEQKSSSSDENRCTCGDSSESVTLNKCKCPTKRKLTGSPTCAYERSEQDPMPTEDVTTSTQYTSFATKTDETTKKDSTATTSIKTESIDSRIFSLKKLPTSRKAQTRLLKKVLNSLAEDGYPLAQLPDIHELPIFKLWFDKRNGKYISMEQRAVLARNTIQLSCHIYKCKRFVRLPKLKWDSDGLEKLKWNKVYTYQKYVYGLRDNFNRRLKQAYISMAQENFPTCFPYELPTKTFRDCYFAYMPGDENHAYVFKPWKIHEVKKSRNS